MEDEIEKLNKNVFENNIVLQRKEKKYRWRPPQSETTIRNLVETRTLRVGQFLELHAFFEARRLK